MLLDMVPDGPGWVVADKGYSSDAIRERVWAMGAARHSGKAQRGPCALPGLDLQASQ